MAELAAVVGIGQTSYTTKRGDVSIAGLVREAAVNALSDADLTWDDIDAVIVGKAPDMFEGVSCPRSISRMPWAATASRCCACTPPA